MKYTKELLDSILKEGEATLLEEYERYNQRIVVKFRCKCGNDSKKRFEMLHLYRCPYCEDCSKKIYVERRNQSWKEKYGVTNIFQEKDIIEKINQTFHRKYGCHPKQTYEVQQKWKATCLEKYGGHPNQNSEVQAKSEHTSFQYKDYKLPSGKIVKIQGYEDKALDELLQYFVEQEIAIGKGNMPRIQYMCSQGINRIYFPDFYIESTNTILEIKSEWTVQLKTCRLQEKADAVIREGYKYEVWIYDDRKKKKRILTF